MHSWRVLILPYLGYEQVYAKYDFNEPWDGVNNTALGRSVPRDLIERFQCPVIPKGDESNYVAIRGESSRTLNCTALCGAKNIMIVEVQESKINWMEPRDIFVGSAPDLLKNHHGVKGINCVTCDGEAGTIFEHEVVFRGTEDELLKRWLDKKGQ